MDLFLIAIIVVGLYTFACVLWSQRQRRLGTTTELPSDWVNEVIRELIPICSTTKPAQIKYFLPRAALNEKERSVYDEGKAIWFSKERVEELSNRRIPVAYERS